MSVGLVTGASRGLGRAFARALAERGWRLLIDARQPGLLADAHAELSRLTEVVAVVGDVSDGEHRQRLVDAAGQFGRLDLLVNNASVLGPSPQPLLADYPIAELERVYRVNTVAPLALIQALLPLLARGGGARGDAARGDAARGDAARGDASRGDASPESGVIVNVTSDAAVEPYPGWGGYGSAKAALDQLTAVLAAEQPALHVYAFDPGDMRTQLHQQAFPGEDISDRPDPAVVVPALLELVAGHLPSGRYRAEELAATGAVPA